MTARSSGARGLAAATALVLWAGCGGHETTSSTVVPPVALALRGADVSALARIEQGGGVFRDSGRAGDALAILRSRGANLFRLRLFVSPNDSDVQVNDLAYTAAMAGRVKAAGAKLLLDIHYSDTWADPGHQTTPAAWSSLGFDSLEAEVERYTDSVVGVLKQAGALPDIVQVGNEIDGGMLWPLASCTRRGPTRRCSGRGSPASSRPACAECVTRSARPTPSGSCSSSRRAATPAAPRGSSTT